MHSSTIASFGWREVRKEGLVERRQAGLAGGGYRRRQVRAMGAGDQGGGAQRPVGG